MRTTMALDDKLVAEAQDLTGLKEKSSLIREALKALIERESARRLARLGGTEPHLRRRQDAGLQARDPGRYVGLGSPFPRTRTQCLLNCSSEARR